jgi:antirestriction protein
MSKKRPAPGSSTDEILDYAIEQGAFHDHSDLPGVDKAEYAGFVADIDWTADFGYTETEHDIFRAGYYHGMKSQDKG